MPTRSFALSTALFVGALSFFPLPARVLAQDAALSPAPVTQTAPTTTRTKKRRRAHKTATPVAAPTEQGVILPDQVHPITSLPKAPGDTSPTYDTGTTSLPSNEYTPAPRSTSADTVMPADSTAPTSIVPLSEGSPAMPPAPSTGTPASTTPRERPYTQPGQATPYTSAPAATTAPTNTALPTTYAQPGQTLPNAPSAAVPAYTPPAPQPVDVGPPPTQVTYTEAPMPSEPVYVGKPHVRPFSAIAVQLKAGFAGIGVDVATPLAQRFNLRVGGSFFQYNGTYYSDGLQITGDAKFRSGSAAIDIFPFNNGFRISPGITFYNGNQFNANVTVPGNTTFDLGDGSPTLSDPNNPIHGTAVMSFGKQYAPSLTIGWGNMIPRSGKHLSFPFEIGAQYIDNPSMAITLAGNACATDGSGCENIATDPIAQQNLKEEQADINSALHSYLRFYPIISIGVAWRFGSWK